MVRGCPHSHACEACFPGSHRAQDDEVHDRSDDFLSTLAHLPVKQTASRASIVVTSTPEDLAGQSFTIGQLMVAGPSPVNCYHPLAASPRSFPIRHVDMRALADGHLGRIVRPSSSSFNRLYFGSAYGRQWPIGLRPCLSHA